MTTTVAPEKTTDTAPEEATVEEPETTSAAAQIDYRAAYAEVLANPGAYPPNPAARYEPTGTYSYALVEATGDDIPDLLLRVDSKEFSPVLLLKVDSNGTVVASTDVVLDGAAGAGGSRSEVFGSREGSGIYEVSSQSLRPEGRGQRYLLEGTSLVRSGEPQTFNKANGTPADYFSPNWLDTTDPSGLDG